LVKYYCEKLEYSVEYDKYKKVLQQDIDKVEEIISNDSSLLKSLGNVANNIAMISTSCNVIREYNININFNIDSWEV
jgi:hypothetical protein